MGRQEKEGVSQKTCHRIIFNTAFGKKGRVNQIFARAIFAVTIFFRRPKTIGLRQLGIGLLILGFVWAMPVYAGIYRFEPKLISHRSDTGKVLQTIQILGIRYSNFYTGNKFSLIDSNILSYNRQNTLADLLSNNSQIFIKSYGPGMLASPGFRGGNANHTAVLWNGFNLQNPMNAQVDLSSIPAFLIEQAGIQYGSAANLFGSGTIGGAIHLQTQQNQKAGFHLEAMTGIASFGNYTGGLKVALIKNKWNIQQKFFIQEAENNYWFKPTLLLEPNYKPNNNVSNMRATWAQYSNMNWIQEFQYQLKSNQKIGVKTWLQRNNRHIPAALFSPNTQAKQLDQSAKILFEHAFKSKAIELNSRYSFFKDIIEFQDQNTPVAKSLSNCHTISLDQTYFHTRFQLQTGFWLQHADARLSGEKKQYQINKLALFAVVKTFQFNHRLQHQISLRKEWTDEANIPLIPAYGMQFSLNKKWSVFGNVSGSYRLPGFNDLYWPEMGNPELKPESGWNAELNLANEQKINRVQTKTTLTVFNKQINNWIIWVPKGGTLSTPKNIYRVWSRGIECDWQAKTILGKFEFQLQGLHGLTLATNEESEIPNDASLHKQIIYTPRVKHSIQWQVRRQNYSLRYVLNYVGTRFVSADHSNWLNPYNYSTLSLERRFILKKNQYNLQLSVNNLFNQNYQVIVNRPLPLINYQLSIFIKL